MNRPSQQPRRRRRASVGVVTVDDHECFRRVAKDVIEATSGFELLGEAASGEEALDVVADLDPDLVLVDVRMPGIGGVETARRLCTVHPRSTVVLVSSDDSPGLPSDIGRCGAAAFLPKEQFGQPALRKLWAAHGAPSPAGDPG